MGRQVRPGLPRVVLLCRHAPGTPRHAQIIRSSEPNEPPKRRAEQELGSAPTAGCTCTAAGLAPAPARPCPMRTMSMWLLSDAAGYHVEARTAERRRAVNLHLWRHFREDTSSAGGKPVPAGRPASGHCRPDAHTRRTSTRWPASTRCCRLHETKGLWRTAVCPKPCPRGPPGLARVWMDQMACG